MQPPLRSMRPAVPAAEEREEHSHDPWSPPLAELANQTKGREASVSRWPTRTPVSDEHLSSCSRTLEDVQAGLMSLSRKHESVIERVTRMQQDCKHVESVWAENEQAETSARSESNEALQSLTRRLEDNRFTCEVLQTAQERIGKRIEAAGSTEGSSRIALDVQQARSEVSQVQAQTLEKLEVGSQLMQRLQRLEPKYEEHDRLRQDAEQLRHGDERRDLEVAAVQGQIDALTKLIRKALDKSSSH